MRSLMIGLVCIAGAVLGWNAAAATHSNTKHHLTATAVAVGREVRHPAGSPSITLVVVPMPAVALSEEGRQAQEMERLEARNRRLEALVKVLRTRDMERQP